MFSYKKKINLMSYSTIFNIVIFCLWRKYLRAFENRNYNIFAYYELSEKFCVIYILNEKLQNLWVYS